jgi:hypothetical protein
VLTLPVFAILVYSYSQTGKWQYLALMVIDGAIAAAHLGAWWLYRAYQQTNRGIWLIGAVHLLSAILLPLLITDPWLTGIYLLALVPLEIGTVGYVRRIPLLIISSLIGAVLMVAADLLALPGRISAFLLLPDAVIASMVLFALHLLGLGFLLWYFRMRNTSPHFVRLNLAAQQALVFTMISAISIVIVAWVLIAQIRNAQIEQVGQNFQTFAQINAQRARSTSRSTRCAH